MTPSLRSVATRPVYLAHLNIEGQAASTAYVLVDLSDTTNYPHTLTNELHILGMEMSIEKLATSVYDFWFGVILEVDASNGTAEWIHVVHMESAGARTRVPIDCTRSGSSPEGWNLSVIDGATPRIISNVQQAGHVNWQTDTGLASPAGAAGGATGKPGVGDFVMWSEEVSDAGTVSFSIVIVYEAA